MTHDELRDTIATADAEAKRLLASVTNTTIAPSHVTAVASVAQAHATLAIGLRLDILLDWLSAPDPPS